MKWIARLLAVPIGLIFGVIVCLFLYTSIFGSVKFQSFSGLLFKLSPGIIIGTILAFYFPNLFLWVLGGWLYDGDTDSEKLGLTESATDKSDLIQNKNSAKKNT